MTNEARRKFTLKDRAEVLISIDGEDLESRGDFDLEVRDGDGHRWSATALTLDAICRIMARHALSGESCHGRFFHRRDLLILRQPGVTALVTLLNDMIDDRELRQVLTRIDEDDPLDGD